MAEFVLNISGKNGKSYKKEITGAEADNFLNKKIKDKIKGDPIGFKGYELEITGGSDKHGFPIREDVIPGTRKKPLVVGGIGAKPKDRGVKQRKTVRGNIIDDNIKQINLKVKKEGTNSLEKIFGGESEEDKTKDLPKEKETSEKLEQTKEETKEIKENEGKESEETKK